jgi:hypothetical protein
MYDGTGWIQLAQDRVQSRTSEHGNEPSGFIKDGEFSDELSIGFARKLYSMELRWYLQQNRSTFTNFLRVWPVRNWNQTSEFREDKASELRASVGQVRMSLKAGGIILGPADSNLGGGARSLGRGHCRNFMPYRPDRPLLLSQLVSVS